MVVGCLRFRAIRQAKVDKPSIGGCLFFDEAGKKIDKLKHGHEGEGVEGEGVEGEDDKERKRDKGR